MPAPVKFAQPTASRNAPVLGSWREGRFDFASPAARETWHRSAFAQGIDPETWQLGAEVDDKTRHLIAANLAGPMPPFYHGPDGRPRFGNLKTIERPSLRDIRARSFGGKSMSAIEAAYAGGKLPGEDEAVGHLLGHGPTAAVSSSYPGSTTIPANSNMILTPENKGKQRVELLNSGPDEKKLNNGGLGEPVIRLAQADNTGTVSDAVSDAPSSGPNPLAPKAVATDRWREAGIPPHVPYLLAYPSGALAPDYKWEEKAMGPEDATAAAEAAIRHLPRASHWPVEGKRDETGKRILNERNPGRDQGDGRYGMTRNSGTKKHSGFDIAADLDDPVVAVNDGEVVLVVNDVPGYSSASTYGNQVIIEHADGTYTQYAHMEPALDKDGKPLKDRNGNDRKILRVKDKVTAGQQIGSVGRTGNVGDPAETDMQKQPDTHLHFEVRYGDAGKNPSKRVTIHPAYYLPVE